MRNIRLDRSGLMINYGPAMIASVLLFLTASASVWLHTAGVYQGGLMTNLFEMSPILVAGAAMLIVQHRIKTMWLVVVLGLLAGIGFYWFTRILLGG